MAMKNMLDTEPGMPGNKMERYGASVFMNDILSRLDNPAATDWDSYDPLGLDKA